MDQECGEELKEIHIWENGKWGKQTVTAYILGLMAIGMKANLNNV